VGRTYLNSFATLDVVFFYFISFLFIVILILIFLWRFLNLLFMEFAHRPIIMTQQDYSKKRIEIINYLVNNCRERCDKIIRDHENILAIELEWLEKQYEDSYWNRFLNYCRTGE